MGFLTELLIGWAGAECEIPISILSAYWVGPFRAAAKFRRDVIIKFPHWAVKAKILESY